jgi:signal transduction histidine kinase
MRFGRSRFAVYVFGIVGALSITIILTVLVIRPPLGDMLYLALLLGLTSIASAAIGYVSHRLGWWQRLGSLRVALSIGYVLAAGLTLLNVWITAQLMFINQHDLALAVMLLVFAGAISVAFGYFLSGSVTQALSDLAAGAKQVGEGNFSVRVDVKGEDEVARLSETFNMMAVRLERAAAEAEALDEARRNLVAWASHDLRTPLASLRAMIDALADGVVKDEETTRRYLVQSQGEITRMSHLIDDLFELAQLDTGQYPLECVSASLSDLVSDTLAAFTARSQAKQITLRGSVGPDIDPVKMAPDKISRVLYNLLENAIHHTPQGGAITLEVIRQDGQVLVAIQDSGEGIPPQDIGNVFDPFYRGERSRTRGGYGQGGAGLGLAIARGLVEAHGGRIWAESELGKGTLMSFILPREGRADR